MLLLRNWIIQLLYCIILCYFVTFELYTCCDLSRKHMNINLGLPGGGGNGDGENMIGSVAAQGWLPPEANVCIAAPANQISSAIRVFFRIFRHGGPASSFPSHLLPSPSTSYPKVGPLNPARRSGECCKLCQQGLGCSRRLNWIWCILALKSDIWLQQI